MYETKFSVKGNGEFPHDMLRFDECFPVSSSDAAGIESPYLERNDIYDAYDFNEPWNGPNNSKLAEISVGIFQCPLDANVRGTPYTNYVAVVGTGTVWNRIGVV